jgi:hypothetical protein
LWSYAYENLKTATPLHRLKSEIVDLFLFKSWLVQDKNNRHAYYIDMSTLQKIYNHNLKNSIHQILFVPPGSRIPTKPVLFSPTNMQKGSMQFKMVLFDYSANVVLILSKSRLYKTNMYASWEDWDGLKFWKDFAHLFGWDVGQKPKVIEPNWTKVKCFLFLYSIFYILYSIFYILM